MLTLTREERAEDGLIMRSYRDGKTLAVVAITRDGFTKVIASHGTAMDARMQRVDSTFVLARQHSTLMPTGWTLDGQPVSLLETPHAHGVWQRVYGEPSGTIVRILIEWAARLARERYEASPEA